MSYDKQLESKTLKINLIIAIAYAFFSIIIVYFAQSLTVLLDTGYSVISIVLYAISIYILRKINQPADKHYHYGYHRLEPIFIILESSFVLLIAFSVILIAIFNLFTHVIKPNYGVALLSEIIGTTLCVFMFLFVNSRAKKTRSKILLSDALMWKADAFLGMGVVFNIAIGFFLEKIGHHMLALYVDPIVAIFIGGYIMINPIRLGKEAYQHLLDAAPNPKFKRKSLNIAKRIAKNFGVCINDIKITQSGRFIFIDVYLVLPEVIETQKLINFRSQLQYKLENYFLQNILKVYVVF